MTHLDLKPIEQHLADLERLTLAGADTPTLAVHAAVCAADIRPLLDEVKKLRGTPPDRLDWDRIYDGLYGEDDT